MRGITVVVIVLGVMIVVLSAIVIGTIAGRLARAPSQPARAFGGTVEIPRGARIAAMTTGGDRLVVDLALPDGGQQLLVIDLATGTRRGTIDLREAR